jgi:suppressor of ftsI
LIEIDGLVNLLPKSLHDIKQRTLALRDFEVGSDPATQSTRTVNGMINPQFSIAPGETQLWKLANIGSELFYNVILPGHVFYVIAENGMPVWRVWETDKLLLPSGKRYEVLVISRTNGTFPLTALSYQQGCVVCPQVTLATLNVEGPPVEKTTVPTSLIPKKALDGLPIANRRTLTFSSNDSASRYMIDNQVFDPQRVDVRVRLGRSTIRSTGSAGYSGTAGAWTSCYPHTLRRFRWEIGVSLPYHVPRRWWHDGRRRGS